MEGEPAWENRPPAALFNTVVLNKLFQYFSKDERRGILRLVCSLWNQEIMRNPDNRPGYLMVIKNVAQLRAGFKLLPHKTVDNLATRFVFLREVDPTNPLFLDFLTAAGEHSEEIHIYFRDVPHSGSVLRRVLERCPKLEVLGFYWARTTVERLSEDIDVKPVFPNLKRVFFNIVDQEVKYVEFFRDLLEAIPNLRDLHIIHDDNYRVPSTWLFNTVVMDPTFPDLTFLQDFHAFGSLKLTEPECKALARRRFPLKRIMDMDCSGSISRETLDELFRSLSKTLKIFKVRFSEENSAELSEPLKALSNLEVLLVKEFQGSVELVARNMPKLTRLELEYSRPESLFPNRPESRVPPHDLRNLVFRCPYENHGVETCARILFPNATCVYFGARRRRLSSLAAAFNEFLIPAPPNVVEASRRTGGVTTYILILCILSIIIIISIVVIMFFT